MHMKLNSRSGQTRVEVTHCFKCDIFSFNTKKTKQRKRIIINCKITKPFPKIMHLTENYLVHDKVQDPERFHILSFSCIDSPRREGFGQIQTFHSQKCTTKGAGGEAEDLMVRAAVMMWTRSERFGGVVGGLGGRQ